MRILFSPIGGSDPVNAGHDGSWLHCCRHYMPDLTIIYLSKEMLERQENKQLYSRALKKLGDQIGHTIDLQMEKHPELLDPHLLDVFYADFENTLKVLHNQYPDAEIFVNISSGTPAMKGCLIHLYHLLPFQITLIQVNGPHTEMVNGKGSRAVWGPDYDLDTEWENNLDNLEDAPNRCQIAKDEQQTLRLQVMQIKALVKHNEFYAASLLADEMSSYLSEDARNCLRAASDRQQLNLYAAGCALNKYGFQDGSVLQAHSKELLYQGAEMTLTMQCDLDRDDIAGCARKLTPVLFSLLAPYIKILGIDVTKFTDNNYKNIYENRLSAAYPDFYASVWNKLYQINGIAKMAHDNLLTMVRELPCNTAILNDLYALRDIEKNARNDIAHKPVKMSKKDFITKAKKTPEEMLKLIQSLFERIDPALFNSSYWESYDRMKAFLVNKL